MPLKVNKEMKDFILFCTKCNTIAKTNEYTDLYKDSIPCKNCFFKIPMGTGNMLIIDTYTVITNSKTIKWIKVLYGQQK